MKRMLLAILAASMVLSLPVRATEGGDIESLDSTKVDRAQQLLKKAVDFYRSKGEGALDNFNRGGKFADKELYVYVLNTEGVMLASGGSSAELIGRNVSDMKDAAGKPFFQEMLKGAQHHGAGNVEYRWLNRVANRVERKLAFYQREGDKIIAVGFYIPRATPGQARDLLNRAVTALGENESQAIAQFNDINGPFVFDDLYVFVVAIDSARFTAHGTMPRLIGTDGKKLLDAKGSPIIVKMLDIVAARGEGELDYVWRSPVTRKLEKKHTFVKKTGNNLVGVGYYTR